MRRALPPIHESLEELQVRLRQCRDGRLKWRLQLPILIQQGAVHSRQEAAQRLAQHRNTIGRWLSQYEREGLAGLLSLVQAGAPPGSGRLSEAMRQALGEQLAEPSGFSSYQEVRLWLYDQFGHRFPYSTVHRWVRYGLNAKLKRPRPEHPQKKVADAAAFAKHLDRGLALVAGLEPQQPQARPLRLCFQDESRVGLHLALPRRLTAAGVKPYQPYAPLYQYYWLYAAVEPTTGEAFWYEMPTLDRLCFQAFIEQLSQQYPDSLNLLVVDNAPAHTAHDVALPDNILLWGLPPYCPELKPVERLWQALKRRIDVFDHQVRTSLTALRDHVAEIINAYTTPASSAR